MSEFSDKQILDFAKNNLVFEKCEVTGAMQLAMVRCDVYGIIDGDTGTVIHRDVGYVRGNVGSVDGKIKQGE